MLLLLIMQFPRGGESMPEEEMGTLGCTVYIAYQGKGKNLLGMYKYPALHCYDAVRERLFGRKQSKKIEFGILYKVILIFVAFNHSYYFCNNDTTIIVSFVCFCPLRHLWHSSYVVLIDNHEAVDAFSLATHPNNISISCIYSGVSITKHPQSNRPNRSMRPPVSKLRSSPTIHA